MSKNRQQRAEIWLERIIFGLCAAAVAVWLLFGASGCLKFSTTEDNYCLKQCSSEFDNVVAAEWHGDDSFTKHTRCACKLQDPGTDDTTILLRRYPPGPWVSWTKEASAQ